MNPSDTPAPDRSPLPASPLDATDAFAPRHIGPRDADIDAMLAELGYSSLEQFSEAAIPPEIRLRGPLVLEGADGRAGEFATLARLHAVAEQNEVVRSFIGMGYYDTITPPVIQRNVLEDPGWYTPYTPYQAEISQGRLEALLNFQTMVAELTALPVAGASLLDEATAAAEAMSMCEALSSGDSGPPRQTFIAAPHCHPQTLAVLATRARSLGIRLRIEDPDQARLDRGISGVLVQYPTTDGRVEDFRELTQRVHHAGARLVVATDLLALTLLAPPGEWGADIAVGSAQRFGVPMGAGGPHPGFIAARSDALRRMPGRIIGVSRDALGRPALRMAIQTREQHIRRERATSNICTAQALLAIVAAMYAVYHGPEGLRRMARRVHACACALRRVLRRAGHDTGTHVIFDTLRVRPADRTAADVLHAARALRINLRDYGDGTVGVALGETTTRDDLRAILEAFGVRDVPDLDALADPELPPDLRRTSPYLTHPVFNRHHSETEMLRYLTRLRNRDLSLAQSMIPLGSCTMKLNATSEMMPLSWPKLARIHPFAPRAQRRGYEQIIRDLERWLAAITGLHAVSLQPNAGSQGEYAGLLAIRAWHARRGQEHRTVCLIPQSAHGTNPASAVMAGLRVVPVACTDMGAIDLDDLRHKARQHARDLAAIMITYPSTYGVFEENIRDVCRIVHECGGQVYFDGANMNAMVGLATPGDIGADVCHLNLHKTFCIPHGGGGPGMGPIAVAAHLAPFLPGHPQADELSHLQAVGPVAAAPYGSPSILVISWMYIALMGATGLTRATRVALLNANYMARRLERHYPVIFRGRHGLVAHEFILDLRPFEKSAGVRAEDVAKRLMDFGFHAPTMSFPVPGSLMIEPTESEPREELDRFCDAMIHIRREIEAIERGHWPRDDNPLRHAPHTADMVAADHWPHPYTRQEAAFPLPWVRERKFWPPVARVDNPYGDRHLVCVCPRVESYGT